MSYPASPDLAYLRQVAAGAKWVCSVCEGALLLARAGLLDNAAAEKVQLITQYLPELPVHAVMGEAPSCPIAW